MNLLENPITTHRHARWFALAAFAVGWVSINFGYFIQDEWGLYAMIMGLIVWHIPVMWCGYKFAKGGKS